MAREAVAKGVDGNVPVFLSARIVREMHVGSEEPIYEIWSPMHGGSAFVTEAVLRAEFEGAAESMLSRWQAPRGTRLSTNAGEFNPAEAVSLLGGADFGAHPRTSTRTTQPDASPACPAQQPVGQPGSNRQLAKQEERDGAQATGLQLPAGGGQSSPHTGSPAAERRSVDGAECPGQQGRQHPADQDPSGEPSGRQSQPRQQAPPAYLDDHDPSSSYCDPDAAAAMWKTFTEAFARAFHRKRQSLQEQILLARHVALFGARRAPHAGQDKQNRPGADPAEDDLMGEGAPRRQPQLVRRRASAPDPATGPAAPHAVAAGAAARATGAPQRRGLAVVGASTVPAALAAQAPRPTRLREEDEVVDATEAGGEQGRKQDGRRRSPAGVADGDAARGAGADGGAAQRPGKRRRGVDDEGDGAAGRREDDVIGGSPAEAQLWAAPARHQPQPGGEPHQQQPAPPSRVCPGQTADPPTRGPSATSAGVATSISESAGAALQPRVQDALPEPTRYCPAIIPSARAEAALRKLGQALRACRAAAQQDQANGARAGVAQQAAACNTNTVAQSGRTVPDRRAAPPVSGPPPGAASIGVSSPSAAASARPRNRGDRRADAATAPAPGAAAAPSPAHTCVLMAPLGGAVAGAPAVNAVQVQRGGAGVLPHRDGGAHAQGTRSEGLGCGAAERSARPVTCGTSDASALPQKGTAGKAVSGDRPAVAATRQAVAAVAAGAGANAGGPTKQHPPAAAGVGDSAPRAPLSFEAPMCGQRQSFKEPLCPQPDSTAGQACEPGTERAAPQPGAASAGPDAPLATNTAIKHGAQPRDASPPEPLGSGGEFHDDEGWSEKDEAHGVQRAVLEEAECTGPPEDPQLGFASQGIQTSQWLLDSWVLLQQQQQRQVEPAMHAVAVQTSQALAHADPVPPLPASQPQQGQQGLQPPGHLGPPAAPPAALSESPPASADQQPLDSQAPHASQAGTVVGVKVARSRSEWQQRLGKPPRQGRSHVGVHGSSRPVPETATEPVMAAEPVTVTESGTMPGMLPSGAAAGAQSGGVEPRAQKRPAAEDGGAAAHAATAAAAAATPPRPRGRQSDAAGNGPAGRGAARGAPLEDARGWMGRRCAPLAAPSGTRDSLDGRNPPPAVVGRRAAGDGGGGQRRDCGRAPQAPSGVGGAKELEGQLLSVARDARGGALQPDGGQRAAPPVTAAAATTREAAILVASEADAGVRSGVQRRQPDAVGARGATMEQPGLAATAPLQVPTEQLGGGQQALDSDAGGAAGPATAVGVPGIAVGPAGAAAVAAGGAEQRQQTQQAAVEDQPAPRGPLTQVAEFVLMSAPPDFFTQPFTQLF